MNTEKPENKEKFESQKIAIIFCLFCFIIRKKAHVLVKKKQIKTSARQKCY